MNKKIKTIYYILVILLMTISVCGVTYISDEGVTTTGHINIGTSIYLDGITLSDDNGCFKTSDFHAHGTESIAGYYKLKQGATPSAYAESNHSILWVDSNEDLNIQDSSGVDAKLVRQTGGGITIEESSIQASIFRSNSSDSYVFIDSNYDRLGTEKSILVFSDNRTHKWRIEKDDLNNFALYDNARADNVLRVEGNGDMLLMEGGGSVRVGADLDVNDNISVPELYLKENGNPTGANNVYFTERPNAVTRRVMMYGAPQNSGFGFVVAPTGTTLTDMSMTLWGSNIDDGGSTDFAQLFFDGANDGDLTIKTTVSIAGGLSGDILFSPNSTERMKIDSDGDVTISELAGTGNAYACLDSNGMLYRSATACVP